MEAAALAADLAAACLQETKAKAQTKMSQAFAFTGAAGTSRELTELEREAIGLPMVTPTNTVPAKRIGRRGTNGLPGAEVATSAKGAVAGGAMERVADTTNNLRRGRSAQLLKPHVSMASETMFAKARLRLIS